MKHSNSERGTRNAEWKKRHWRAWLLLAVLGGVAFCVTQMNAAEGDKARKGAEAKPPAGDVLEVAVVKFSKNPTEAEIKASRVFLEPLVPMGKTQAKENADLAAALLAWKATKDQEDLTALSDFLKKYPKSAWRASLEVSLGQLKYERGYLSEALALWEDAWNTTKGEKDSAKKAVADAALGQLLVLQVRLGHKEELEKFFAENPNRHVTGSVEEKVNEAREGLKQITNLPQVSCKCGPFAIDMLAQLGRKVPGRSMLIEKAQSTAQGTNLAQVQQWSDQLGLHYQMAKRSPGAPFITPAVMHWKLGHFAALTEEHDGKYHIMDPTFGNAGRMWISAKALEAETSGYFLVPAGPLPKGWQTVEAAEGEKIWGKGPAHSRNEDNKDPCAPQTNGGCSGGCSGGGGGGSSDIGNGYGSGGSLPVGVTSGQVGGAMASLFGGMAVPTVYSMQATQAIRDTPLWYKAPYGPGMAFGVTYNYLETNQPVTFNFTNFTADWECTWLSYLTVDASRNVTVRLRGGGSEVFAYSLPDNNGNSYAPNLTSQATMNLTVAGTYERRLSDGSTEVYSKVDGSGRIFLTAVKDPQGNAATVNYDANFRITTVADAVGKTTSFTYSSTVPATTGYYLVSTITDPYGRSASFTYDSTQTQLLSITDSIGITSQFTYDTGSFIAALTTPYGKTLFYQYIPPNDPAQNSRGLKTTFPDGSTSVVENWLGSDGETKSTYYWDRHATQLYPNDPPSGIYTHCVLTYWLVNSALAQLEAVPGYVKKPLESQITYSYADQSESFYIGTSNRPTQISRLMDDGSTQTYQYQRNPLGHMTKYIDPVGRTFSYLYAANNIDLLETRQTRNGNNDLLGKWVYTNTQHRPNKHIDGSGQQTQFSYNSFGQPLAIVNAISDTTTMVYTASTGQLAEIDVSSTFPNAKTTFTYDNGTTAGVTTAGLPKTISIATSGSTNYTATYTYDSASRPLTITYPDGTFIQAIYTYLDATLFRDRLGRWGQQSFDSLRQKVSQSDPLGRTTKFTWCTCGAMSSLTDANGNQTNWTMDLEGRVTLKTYADSGTIGYVYENTTSRLKSTTDALNQTKNYTYNLDNTLAGVTYTNVVNATPPVAFTYDPDYRRVLTVATTGTGGWNTIGYGYNAFITDPFGTPTTGAGMVETATNTVIANSDVAYAYDSLRRLTSQSINGSPNTSWAYDALSRVTATGGVLGSTSYSYLNVGYGLSQLSQAAYANSQTANYSWFGNSGDLRLQEIQNTGTAALSQFDYGYDSVGNITSWTQAQSGTSTLDANTYDFANQLTGVGATVSGTLAQSYYYNYDLAANRISEQIYTGTSSATVTSATYNNVNELSGFGPGGATRFTGTITVPGTVSISTGTSGTNAAFMNWSKQFSANPVLVSGTNSVAVIAKDGGTHSGTSNYTLVIPAVTSGSLTYDADGNLINDGTNTYQWDAENRLIGIVYSGSGNSTEFTYDPLGRRAKIAETIAGIVTSTRQFVYCGNKICEERDGVGALTKQFTNVGMTVSGTRYFYTRDHLGSIRELVSGGEAIQAQYAYDPYGRATKLQGAMDADFQYTGLYYHGRSGLNLSATRAYNSNLGRWLSRDTLRNAEVLQGSNLYFYVGNNPFSKKDPKGQFNVVVVAVFAVVAVGIVAYNIFNAGNSGQQAMEHADMTTGSRSAMIENPTAETIAAYQNAETAAIAAANETAKAAAKLGTMGSGPVDIPLDSPEDIAFGYNQFAEWFNEEEDDEGRGDEPASVGESLNGGNDDGGGKSDCN